MSYQNITTDEELRKYCDELAAAPMIGFDTEFVAEHTFRPVLCLVQVVAQGRLALIDPLTVGDMTPFWEAIAGPGHETVVHAGRGEMEFCLQATGRLPAQLFDVQLAAGLVGVEYPAGYGTLIRGFWAKRRQEARNPHRLAAAAAAGRQIEYALDDVRYLEPIVRSRPASAGIAARWSGWPKRWPPGSTRCRRALRRSGGGRCRAMPAWGAALWPSSASCGAGGRPRPSRPTNPRGRSSATT